MINPLIDERPLIVQPSLVKMLGSMERAVVLQQIHWLLQQPKTGIVDDSGVKWVWGTIHEWCDDYFSMWSARTLRMHLKWLRDNGYLITEKLEPSGWDKTNKYTLNYAVFERQDAAPSKRQDAAPSKRQDSAPSKRQDAAASNKEQRLHRDFTEKGRKSKKLVPPDWLNTEAWELFEDSRRRGKHPLTDAARRLAWGRLEGLTHEQQMNVIAYSVIGGYRGIFPEKKNWSGWNEENRNTDRPEQRHKAFDPREHLRQQMAAARRNR